MIGKRFEEIQKLDKYPVDSKLLNICKVAELSKQFEVFEVDKIQSKACLFAYENIFYASKLLHF